MNILFLTQVLPYPMDAGPKTRAYLVLRHLAESNHEVTLISFTRAADRLEDVHHLSRYCRRIHTLPMPRSRFLDGVALMRSFITGKPFLVTRDWIPSMARLIKDVLRREPSFDAVHSDQLWMAPYALLARNCAPAGNGPLVVLDQHNAVFNVVKRLAGQESNPLKRAILRREARIMARHEEETCRRFDRIVWVTEQDRQAFLARQSQAPAGIAAETVIPIAVDPAVCLQLDHRAAKNRITFLGGLHWPPNSQGIRWFIREVWPQVKILAPNLILTVIGRDSSRELASVSDSSIEATGYVDDPAPFLSETAVIIVPLLAAGGMRVKILDAWSWGLPVVSTTIGAEGIQAIDRENIRLADRPADFAAAVLEVARDPLLASRLTLEGRRTLQSHYDWRKLYQAWDRIYQTPSA
ncbi:MAG: glycosyltransferase [Acidobacteria bacterium]|nr:glycosyltransferase [Acidobacteriota bacterium]